MKRVRKLTFPARPSAVVPLLLLFTLFALLTLTACGLSVQEALTKGLEEGKSIVIFQQPQNNPAWDCEKVLLDEDGYQLNQCDGADFNKGRNVGADYLAVAVHPGDYFLKTVYMSSRSKNLRNDEYYESRFGWITVFKTPEKERVQEEVYVSPEYRTEKDSLGNPRQVLVREGHWETREYTGRLDSYYVWSIDFTKDRKEAGPDYVGSVSIGPGEVVLLPSVWGSIGLADGSCRKTKGDGPGAVDRFFNTVSALTLRLLADHTENGYETWEWFCPVESVIFTIMPPKLDDFLQYAEIDKFPPGALERVQAGEFRKGRIFNAEHETEPFEKESRFSGEKVLRHGERYIFRGRPEPPAPAKEARETKPAPDTAGKTNEPPPAIDVKIPDL